MLFKHDESVFSINCFVSNVLLFFMVQVLWFCAEFFLKMSLTKQILLTFTILMITWYLEKENLKLILRYELHNQTEVIEKEQNKYLQGL